MPLVLGESFYTARKTHHCEECATPIEPGTLYVRQRNVQSGEAYTYKAHADCLDVARTLLDEDTVFHLDECDIEEIRQYGGEHGNAVADRIANARAAQRAAHEARKAAS